jgi:hypothetical protein
MVRHSYIDKQRRPGKLIVPRVAKYLEFIESTPIEADQPPNNLNHLMYDLPRMDGAAWGANLPGAPIYFQQLNPAPVTEFYVVMGNWSDGTPVNGAGNSASESHKH